MQPQNNRSLVNRIASVLVVIVLLGIPAVGFLWIGFMVVWTRFFSPTYQPLVYGFVSSGATPSSGATAGMVACLLVGLLFLAHAAGLGGDK